jgi:hypothetical protein
MNLLSSLELHLIDLAIRRAWRELLSDLAVNAQQVCRALLLVTIAIADWALMLEVWKYLREGEQEQLWSVGFLSLTSTIMLLGYHRLARDNPDGPLVGIVRILCVLSVLIFAIGAGGVLTAGIWAGGAQSLFGGSGDVAAQVRMFLGDAAQAAEPGALKTFLEVHAFPVLTVAFACGAGGLTLTAMHLCHRLLENIEADAPRCARLFESIGNVRTGRAIRKELARMDALTLRLEVLDQSLADAPAVSAEKVIDIVQVPVRKARSWINARRIELHPGAPQFPRVIAGRPDLALNPAEFQRMVEDMEAYDANAVLADIRAHQA